MPDQLEHLFPLQWAAEAVERFVALLPLLPGHSVVVLLLWDQELAWGPAAELVLVLVEALVPLSQTVNYILFCWHLFLCPAALNERFTS